MDEARALALAGQGLLDPPAGAADGRAVMATITRTGVLQVDTITVVERSQYLVLWSRLGAYDPALLDSLLYPRRALFECMAPVALIAPMASYRYYRPAMLRAAKDMWSGNRAWLQVNPEAIRDTLEAVRERGPLASSDFERPKEAARTGPWDWHGPKPSRRALEILWWMGELMVHSRRAGQKVYDLRERVLAEAFQGDMPSDDDLPASEERLRFFTTHSVEALGVTVPSWLWGYHAVTPGDGRGANRRTAARSMLETLRAEGQVVAASVAGLAEPAYVATSLLPDLERVRAGYTPSRTTLLSPFDSLIWDRARTRGLFNFDVCFEAYVPPAKRKYGYYCLSILHQGRLVGRIDPKMDRATKRLLVRAVYLEPEVAVDAALVDGLSDALRDLARFLGGTEVQIGEVGHTALAAALKERME
jgi:uncharacterized protein YcaQ